MQVPSLESNIRNMRTSSGDSDKIYVTEMNTGNEFDQENGSIWTIAIVIFLVCGLGGGLYLTKPVYYEMYAMTHPMLNDHEQPAPPTSTSATALGGMVRPGRKEMPLLTEDLEDIILEQRQEERKHLKEEEEGGQGSQPNPTQEPAILQVSVESDMMPELGVTAPHEKAKESVKAPIEKAEEGTKGAEAPVRTVADPPAEYTTKRTVTSVSFLSSSSPSSLSSSPSSLPSSSSASSASLTPSATLSQQPSNVTGLACSTYKSSMQALTEEVQARLFTLQHPQDCSRAKLLECDSSKGMDQGTGSRLFFLTRCLAKCMESGRTCVLNPSMQGTELMLSPFLPWSNCTMQDVQEAKKTSGRVVVYEPKSLPDIAVVDGVKGALFPKQYAKRGYFWWKAQEMMYALRPTEDTKAALKEHKNRIGWSQDGTPVHGMQVRRTDKVEGKLKEADKVPVLIYAQKLRQMVESSASTPHLPPGAPLTVLLSTDDLKIKSEAAAVATKSNINFLANPPAPKRKIGDFKGRVLKDALDILALADTDTMVFTYSSGFGALPFLIKLAKEGYCSNWISVDQGKREWPKWVLIGNGGLNGVSKGSKFASNLCHIQNGNQDQSEDSKFHCNLAVRTAILDSDKPPQRILINKCKC